MHILQKVVVPANLTKKLLHNTQCQIFRFEKKITVFLNYFPKRISHFKNTCDEPELPGHTFKKDSHSHFSFQIPNEEKPHEISVSYIYLTHTSFLSVFIGIVWKNSTQPCQNTYFYNS